MSLQTTLIFNLSFMKDRMCAITSTVHPLPNIRYCCVSLHSHLYQSGIVCNRAHSVGVRRLIIVSICTHGCVLPSFLALAINVHDLSVFILRKCLPPNPHIVPEKTIRLSLWTVVRQFVLLSVRVQAVGYSFSAQKPHRLHTFSVSVFHIRPFLV